MLYSEYSFLVLIFLIPGAQFNAIYIRMQVCKKKMFHVYQTLSHSLFLKNETEFTFVPEMPSKKTECLSKFSRK
jgi:hypothetical protein